MLAALLTLVLVAPPVVAAPARDPQGSQASGGPDFVWANPKSAEWILMIPNLIYRMWHSTGEGPQAYPNNVSYDRNVATVFIPGIEDGKSLCITAASLNGTAASTASPNPGSTGKAERNTDTALIQLLLYDQRTGTFQLVGWDLQPLRTAAGPIDWRGPPTAATSPVVSGLTWDVTKLLASGNQVSASLMQRLRENRMHGEPLASLVALWYRQIAALQNRTPPIPAGKDLRSSVDKLSSEQVPCAEDAANCYNLLNERTMLPVVEKVVYAVDDPNPDAGTQKEREQRRSDLFAAKRNVAAAFAKDKAVPATAEAREQMMSARPFEQPGSSPSLNGTTAQPALPQRLAAGGSGTTGAQKPALAPGATGVAPGGIDFSTLELRYLADPGPGAAQGVRYAFSGTAASGDRNAAAGGTAVMQASDAFFVWLELPPDAFWVNLNPEEHDRIVDPRLGTTDAGRILLQADLQMKKTVAKLIHPDGATGKQFWQQLPSDADRDTCLSFRQWISPGPATVREDGDGVYIVDAPLTVQLESEFLKTAGAAGTCTPSDQSAQEAVYRRLILPKVEEAVNKAPEYAELRRVYLSRVAAEWYRQRSATRPTEYGDLIDRGDVTAWPARRDWSPRTVFDQYVNSYTKGEFHVTHQRRDGDYIVTDTYVYGGVDLSRITFTALDPAAFQLRAPGLSTVVGTAMTRPAADTRGKVWIAAVSAAPALDTAATSAARTGNGWWWLAGAAGAAGLVLLVVLGRRRFRWRRGELVLRLDRSAVEQGITTAISVPGHPRLTVNIPPGARDGSLLRLPGKAGPDDRDDLFVRVRVDRLSPRARRRLTVTAVVLVVIGVFTAFMILKPDAGTDPQSVAAAEIPRPVVADERRTQPHVAASRYAPVPAPTTTSPEAGFAAGTCLTGEIPHSTVAVPVTDVSEVSCSSKAAHYKVIKTFLGTSDMRKCDSVKRTQYAFSETYTLDNVPYVQYVYCLIGLGRYAR
jgi:hypothetical protein